MPAYRSGGITSFAITDPGTELESPRARRAFRDVFPTRPTSARYSALVVFSARAAALMGQDIEANLGWGLAC